MGVVADSSVHYGAGKDDLPEVGDYPCYGKLSILHSHARLCGGSGV